MVLSIDDLFDRFNGNGIINRILWTDDWIILFAAHADRQHLRHLVTGACDNDFEFTKLTHDAVQIRIWNR